MNNTEEKTTTKARHCRVFDVGVSYLIPEIKKLGFTENTKIINGYKPHFSKGDDLLFIMGSDFWIKKIVCIASAFENYNGKIYGVLTDKAPGCSAMDWITAPNLILLAVAPTSIGQWRTDGQDIEFVEASV